MRDKPRVFGRQKHRRKKKKNKKKGLLGVPQVGSHRQKARKHSWTANGLNHVLGTTARN